MRTANGSDSESALRSSEQFSALLSEVVGLEVGCRGGVATISAMVRGRAGLVL